MTNIWYDWFLIFTEYIGCPHFVTDRVYKIKQVNTLVIFGLNSYYLLYFDILLNNFKFMAGIIYFL